MAMTRINANRIWRQPLDVRFGRERFRAISAQGTINVEFMVKLFPSSGSAMVFPGRVKQSSSTLTATVPPMMISGGGGFRMQSYWKFQYDLDVGAFSRLTRLSGARDLANSRVRGLANIIQSFDLVPPRSGSGPYTAAFANMRGDRRPRGAGRWVWGLTHNRTVRAGRDGPSVVTSTRAVLPVEFSGSLSTEVSTSVGVEMGWDLGPAVTGNVSAGTAAGASLDISFRRNYELRLIGNFAPSASV